MDDATGTNESKTTEAPKLRKIRRVRWEDLPQEYPVVSLYDHLCGGSATCYICSWANPPLFSFDDE